MRKEVIIVKLKREGVQNKRESERESAEFRRDIWKNYEEVCGKRKTAEEKKTNLNKKKRKREGERKSQRNQKSDNGARAEKVFALQERRGEIR